MFKSALVGLLAIALATIVVAGQTGARRPPPPSPPTDPPARSGEGSGGDGTSGQATVFTYVGAMARGGGLRMTAQGGVWGGPASVRDAIKDLKVERIGHGARAIEDMALVEEIAETGITLELCPGSNVALGIFPSFRKHPIGEVYNRGVKVTIRPADPPFFSAPMSPHTDRPTWPLDVCVGLLA